MAGADEAREELEEIVEFLRDPKRFKKLGARVPKGVLLYGPPGTGKTLMAKAIATESGANFYFQSASSFVEMFVGVGSARIRAPVRGGAQAPALDHLHRRARRRRHGALGRREQPRARPDAEPAAGGAGRVRRGRPADHHGRVQPARRPRSGAAAPGPVRSPDPRRDSRPEGAPRDPRRAHPQQAAGRAGRPGNDRAPDGRADRCRPGQHLQRGGDPGRAASGPRRSRPRTSTPRSSGWWPGCSSAS